MDLYVDRIGKCFTAGKNTVSRLARVVLGEGDKVPLNVWFLERTGNDGSVVTVGALPDPFTDMAFTGRSQSSLEGESLLFSVTDFTPSGDGDTLHYEGLLNLNTTALAAALSGKKSIAIFNELEVFNADKSRIERYTPHAEGIVYRDIYRGTEGVPAEGDPPYPVPSVLPLLVEAPEDQNDMAPFGGTAPSSGTYLALEDNWFWTFKGGETEWRRSPRNLVT